MRGAFTLFALAAASCGGENAGLFLTVDGDAPAWDSVEITLAAAESETGPICTPASIAVGPGALPYLIEVEAGSRFNALAVLRAVGWSARRRVATREVVVPFQRGKRVEVDVRLDPRCTCEAEEECVAGACRSVPWPGVFDADAGFMDSAPCDSTHTMEL